MAIHIREARTGTLRALRPIWCVAILVVTLVPRSAAAQGGYFVGQSVSWGAAFFLFCDASGCVDAVARSPRSLRSLAVGVDRRIRDSGYHHVSVGATLSRRGWWAGDWTSLTTLSLPVMLVVEPFGADAPFGLSGGAGLSADLAVDRLPDSRMSVTGGFGAYARLTPRLRLSLGVRGSRAIRDIGGTYLRSHVISLGLSLR